MLRYKGCLGCCKVETFCLVSLVLARMQNNCIYIPLPLPYLRQIHTHRRMSLKPCATPGCPYTTQNRHCTHCVAKGIVHVKTHTRRLFDAMYQTPEWRRYSEDYRRKHPLCVNPYHRHDGVLVAVHAVDHVTPHRGNRALFWDPKNHQSLCKDCHAWKSNRERYNLDPTIHSERTVAVSVGIDGGIITDPSKSRRIG